MTDELIILNVRLQDVGWSNTNQNTVVVNSANPNHAHGGGIAAAIAEMFPVDVKTLQFGDTVFGYRAYREKAESSNDDKR